MNPAGEIERIAALIEGEGTVVGILATEPEPGRLLYICAFQGPAGSRTWLVVDKDGTAVREPGRVRDAVAIAALCEIAGDHAFPGDLGDLRAGLLELQATEPPPGIDEAEAATRALEDVLGTPPTVASPARLDAIGAAVRRLEAALDPTRPSPFAAAMRLAQNAVEELVCEVEAGYRLPLRGRESSS